MTKRILNAIATEAWAITPTALEQIVNIAMREGEDVEALEKRLGRPLDNTRTVSVRERTAIIPVSGPIFRYANFFTEISGATSLQMLALDFNEALENKDIDKIILDIDSPGGQVAGIEEFAAMVRAATKPVIAYVGDMAASAAYWIASAANEIVIAKTATVGSIGVVATVSTKKIDGQLEIVSSQSPHKRPDFLTDAGKKQIQDQVDALGKIFVETVAEYRDVSAETVLAEFGKGGMLVGKDAVTNKMVDRIGSLESLITGKPGSNSKKGAIKMPNENTAAVPEQAPVLTAKQIENENKAAYAEILKAGAQQERERIAAIEAVSMPGFEAIIRECKADGQSTAADVALKIVAMQKTQMSNSVVQLKANAPEPIKFKDDPEHIQSSKNLTFDEKVKKDWDADATLRDEYSSFEAYKCYREGEADDSIKVFGAK